MRRRYDRFPRVNSPLEWVRSAGESKSKWHVLASKRHGQQGTRFGPRGSGGDFALSACGQQLEPFELTTEAVVVHAGVPQPPSSRVCDICFGVAGALIFSQQLP